MEEEKMKSANKQKLTAMEKNKLAIMYLDMRQDADVRNELCNKYRINPNAINKEQESKQKRIDRFLKQMKKSAVNDSKKSDMAETTQTKSSPTAGVSVTKLTRTNTFQEGQLKSSESSRIPIIALQEEHLNSSNDDGTQQNTTTQNSCKRGQDMKYIMSTFGR